MEIDSLPPPSADSLSPRARIVQRLVMHGVPQHYTERLHHGLVAFLKDSKVSSVDLVSVLLPTDVEVAKALEEAKAGSPLKDLYHESLVWLQWLMFEGEPVEALENLANMNVGQRGICGGIWGKDDLAFRCRTCEHDPTCAICVPCFKNGNHKDHDYSIIYTGGGCCDCGDETAWKREGFCSNHKGAEKMQSLPENVAQAAGPVLSSLFCCWKEKLLFAERMSTENQTVDGHALDIANEFTSATVDMLLDFCNRSESLLILASRTTISTVGLLNFLIRAEMFLDDAVIKQLHELLLKLLAEPTFKYEFGKILVDYYPVSVNEAIQKSSDTVLDKYPLLSTFCVQIFTVPSLTLRLVKEVNLLVMLLECLGNIFLSCSGEDGRLQINKWGNLHYPGIRVIEDLKYVLSHSEVAQYATHEQQGISRAWIVILSFVQGMDPQKRETGIHVEEETEYRHLPFLLCHSISKINSLLVSGAFMVSSAKETCQGTLVKHKQDGSSEIQRRAKVLKPSHYSSICTLVDQSSSLRWTNLDGGSSSTNNQIFIPSPVLWLEAECLRALGSWLETDSSTGDFDVLDLDVHRSNNVVFKRPMSMLNKGKLSFRLGDDSLAPGEFRCSNTVDEDFSTDGFVIVPSSTDLLIRSSLQQNTDTLDAVDMDLDDFQDQTYLLTCIEEPESLSIFSLFDWPSIKYDVSSQEISFHIPLHGLLSSILKEILRKCYGDSALPDIGSSNFTDVLSSSFFGKIFKGCHPYGFSSFIMEHPLRLRVFCAQVHAGMWKKNGDSATLSCEWYRLVRWSEHELELDLFLLQFCAALAPPDAYVRRILERFGLSSYISLDLEETSEYEPVLVQEMLILIIQIIKERRFCGFGVAENLQRELVCKLAVGDATRSQLVKSLPPDISKSDQVQEILDKIAQFSTPSRMSQGKYSLRHSSWKELDLYHPRWNPKHLQTAEERYLRFTGACALNTQLPMWTKVYPPFQGISRIATCSMVLQIVRAVLFHHIFSDKSAQSPAPDDVLVSALHLLSLGLDICSHYCQASHNSQSDGFQIPLLVFAGEEISFGLYAGQQSLLTLLVLLLKMHKSENSDTYLEAGNLNLPTLVGALLKKFAELDSGCMSKLQQFAPEVIEHLFKCFHNSKEANASGSLSGADKHKAKARERQAAIMAKMKAMQSKFLARAKADANDASDEPQDGKGEYGSDAGTGPLEGKHGICSLCHNTDSEDPLSILVHLQKSRLVSFVDEGAPQWDQVSKSNFEKGNTAVTGKTTGDAAGRSSETSSGTLSSSRWAQMVQRVVNEFSRDWTLEEVSSLVGFLKSKMPELKNVHLPSITRTVKRETAYSLESVEQEMFFSIEKHMGRTASGSANIMDHQEASTNEKRRKATISFLLGKYLASLTKESIGNLEDSNNSVSHSSESAERASPPDEFGPTGSDGVHLSSCGHAVHQACLDRYLSSLRERFMRRINFEGGHIIDPDQGEFLCPVCRRLANSILPEVARHCWEQLDQPTTLVAGPPYCGDTVAASSGKVKYLRLQHAYSLLNIASSVVLEDENLPVVLIKGLRRLGKNLEPVFKALCGMYFPGKVAAFCKSGRVSPSLLMWDTLKYSLVSTEIAARSGRSNATSTTTLDALYKELKSSSGSVLSLLLNIVRSTRSRNVLDILLRFIGIQLLGSSICFGVSRTEGEIMSLLEHIDAGESYPDTLFWNDAAAPVLARDPFSTLMGLLFCLPYPILSSKESILSLVHLFYAVSVTRALVGYLSSCQRSVESFGFHDCLVTDIHDWVGVSPGVQHKFVSNHIEPSCNIRDVIRSFSLPYLRRCALLWKLLSSSMSMSRPHGGHLVDITRYVNDKVVGDLGGESNEVFELEIMFDIPPLDDVLRDGFLRSLAQNWFKHVQVNFENHSGSRVLHLTPNAPFQLVHLPPVYQDLVQRFIKSRCPNCEAVLQDPALCLLCGQLCSPGWKSCCRENGCTIHSKSCGAGTGVFLLIRKTTILLQRNSRQALWSSPYLDAFGEEDVDMQRGKPLYLNEERYGELTYMVASHGLDRSSAVLKQATLGTLFML